MHYYTIILLLIIIIYFLLKKQKKNIIEALTNNIEALTNNVDVVLIGDSMLENSNYVQPNDTVGANIKNTHKKTSRCRSKYHPLCPWGLATINPGVIRGGVGEGEDGLPIIMSNPAMVSDIVTIDLDYKFLPNEKQSDVRKEFEDFPFD